MRCRNNGKPPEAHAGRERPGAVRPFPCSDNLSPRHIGSPGASVGALVLVRSSGNPIKMDSHAPPIGSGRPCSDNLSPRHIRGPRRFRGRSGACQPLPFLSSRGKPPAAAGAPVCRSPGTSRQVTGKLACPCTLSAVFCDIASASP